jgi:microcystin-dependent protein
LLTTLRPISIFQKTSGATASEDDRECGYSANVRYWGNSVHFWILARTGSVANDRKATASAATGSSVATSTSSNAGGGSHNNMQPFGISNFIIKS